MHLMYGSLLDNHGHINSNLFPQYPNSHVHVYVLFITGVVITQKTMDIILLSV